MATRITNKLPEFIDRLHIKAERGMAQALIIGASESSVLTPIATSTLINSQYNNVETKADQVVGTVGYTAAYALPVHDLDNHQKFRRASAEKEFLKKGFENAEPNIRAVLKGAIKT